MTMLTKADCVKRVLDWASKKSVDEDYDYTDPHHCAMAQFHRETGTLYGDEASWPIGAPPLLESLSHGYFDTNRRWTFGALKARLETWLVENEPSILPTIQP